MKTWQKIITISLTVLFTSTSFLIQQAAGNDAVDLNLAKRSIISGPQKTILIELYTSQGCSSCPPAEQYLNSLKDHSELWKTYIPIALHVDYWDYIGWKDQFALPENTSRQRQYAKVNKQRTIYTPGFFVNGKPWRRSFYDRTPSVEKQRAGTLRIDLEGKNLSASFSPATAIKETLVLNVAITGMGYKSDINAGEREGSQPSHDFILLARSQHESEELNWYVPLPRVNHRGATKLAIVAWVSKVDDPSPIQAAGGYLN